MEDPGYDGVRTVFQHKGLNIHPIPLEADGLHIHKLYKSNSRIVYITPSHQFPYGMVMPLAKRMQLLKWATDQNGIIIEDDYDSEFRYVGKPIPSCKAWILNSEPFTWGHFQSAFFLHYELHIWFYHRPW